LKHHFVQHKFSLGRRMAENKFCLHLRFQSFGDTTLYTLSEVLVSPLRGSKIIVNCAVDRYLPQHSCENRRVLLLLLPATRSTTVLNRNFVPSVSLVLFRHDTSHVVHNTAYRWQLFLFCIELSWPLHFIFINLPLPTPIVAQALSQGNRDIPVWNRDISFIKVFLCSPEHTRLLVFVTVLSMITLRLPFKTGNTLE